MEALSRTTMMIVALAAGANAMAQDTETPAKEVLNAGESDPGKLGWMQGFPPEDDKTIRFTDPDYFAFPKLRWTACHFRELMPSTGVRRNTDASMKTVCTVQCR